MSIGYSRQSVADIINGANITAPPLNAEFNAVADAFNSTTGHTHTGTANDGARIPLSTSVTGYLLDINGGVGGRNNTSAVTDPTSTDDSTNGYSVGSIWINQSTNRTHICHSNVGSAAVWFELSSVNHLSQILPKVNNTVDIGSATLQFQDIYIDGTGYIDTIYGDNVDLTGGLNVGGTAALTTATVSNSITVTGSANLGSAVIITGGSVNNAVVGGITPSAVTGTVITANTNFIGPLTGAVTGSLSGNSTGTHSGPVSGDVTSTGTSSFQDVNISGSLNLNAGTTGTVTNLSAPVNPLDAATKNYVDTSLANLVDSAPANLDTLKELATAINDDPSFANNLITSIAAKLPLAGGTMTGDILFTSGRVTGLPTPSTGSDATNKTYVDGFLLRSGGQMSGDIDANNNTVSNLSAPNLANDAANKAYVDAVLGSTTSAAQSAANALQSEQNAAGSATLAQNWATQTGSPVSGGLYSSKYYADQAAASTSAVTQFFGVYHAQATQPTTNIVAGDLWYDTSINQLKIYSSQGAWMDAGSQVNGIISYKHYIVGTSQTGYAGSTTTFPANYDIGFIQVFQNGVLLTPSDYTATNNVDVVLGTPANTGDEITIAAFGTFQVANTYTQNQVDTLLATRDDRITALEDENLLNLGV